MPPPRPYLQHLSTSDDLVTTYEQTRAGFVAIALERSHRANPFVQEARALKAAASVCTGPADLLTLGGLENALLTAAGISEKAGTHLSARDKTEAIERLIENFLEPAGRDFVEELVYRFLLTRGDALGGMMRNVAGELAQRKLTRSIIASLFLAGITCQAFYSEPDRWVLVTDQNANAELSAKGLAWVANNHPRTMLYNRRVRPANTNIDICLLSCDPPNLTDQVLQTPSRYITFGELKGGIDPAGADEHWKTARTALSRIRTAFQGARPSPTYILHWCCNREKDGKRNLGSA